MRKKIGRFVKNNILGFIIGILITTTVGVGAATMFASSDVIYDNSSSGGNSQTVQGAIDELYEKANACSTPTDTTYENGTAVYFNPETGKTCSNYTASQSSGTAKAGCMKWYIFNDEEGKDTVDMILDHNTTYEVKRDNGYQSGPGSDFGDCSPSVVLTQLQSDTSSWTGVPARTDSYTDPLEGYTIDYSGYRARLIEANEIAKITGADTALKWDSGKPYGTTIGTQSSWYYLDGAYGTSPIWQTQVATSQGASHYAWLFDYTDRCTSYGCNTANGNTSGYWTRSSSGHSGVHEPGVCYGWVVRHAGFFKSAEGYIEFGIRPVITIPKSQIS